MAAIQAGRGGRCELDRTRCPGDRVDPAIAVELDAGDDAALLHADLVALLERAGIAWAPAANKARRFFELLEANG